MFGLADRETFSIEYLIVNIATGLLLLGNRLADAQSQLTSTKEPRSAALTPQTRPPVDNAKRITFLKWQLVNSRAKHKFKYK